MMRLEDARLVPVDERMLILVRETGVSAYDFAFERFLPVRHPVFVPDGVFEDCFSFDPPGDGDSARTLLERFLPARHSVFVPDAYLPVVCRVGAIEDYEAFFVEAGDGGLRLINSPAEHRRCSELSGWYPLIAHLTPRSMVFEAPPPSSVIAREFGWPVFLKGDRQTSRHRRSAAVVEGPEEYERAIDEFNCDPILRWQRFVVREKLILQGVGPGDGAAVGAGDGLEVPPSFEFRCFFWRKKLVGFGRYWMNVAEYACSPEDRVRAVRVATAAAELIDVGFVAVDVAKTVSGDWVVIEANDGQESGYAGVSAVGMWQSILDVERGGG